MKKLVLIISIFFLTTLMINVRAEEYYINGTEVRMRASASASGTQILIFPKGASVTLLSTDVISSSSSSCNMGWYHVSYSGKTGYVCKDYVSIRLEGTATYGRPWTSPKKAILGGAEWMSASYINKGQFTSYLKKFNVNPNAASSVYNHQYMANLAAPYSEAYSSYTSYQKNGLLNLALEFTIPIFNNMPASTALPGKSADTSCQGNVTDLDFENKLNAQGFNESYKCKLRLLHNTYPKWTFKALSTGLDFNAAIRAEQAVSSIQGNELYYDKSSGSKVSTEPGWYRANQETVGYYLDPRNFLNAERILMFENLAYSTNYTESVVQTVLNNTFMSGKSTIDNQTYASIFVEAGKKANISAVYLASLAKQESGTKGSTATSGKQFTYKGVTYSGLYNFFNIGAYSSEENPVLAGLVWAAGGSGSVVVGSDSYASSDEQTVLTKLGAGKKQNCLTGLKASSTIKDLKAKLSGLTVTISGNDGDILKTGQTVSIKTASGTYNYTIVINGDVDGDGLIGATDYVRIKNKIMEKAGSEMSVAQSLAADVDGNSAIGATDYVKIKNSIMGR